LLSFAVVLLAWRRQIEVVPWAILAALALTRDLIAYLRLRRQSKVTQ
jgi:hypothetical protein